MQLFLRHINFLNKQYFMKTKIALVTGGTSGIGLAVTEKFIDNGIHVIITGREKSKGEEAIRLLDKKAGKVTFIQSDISKPENIEKLFTRIVDEFNTIDYACNNASTDQGALGAFTADIKETDFDMQINTNLKGTWLCMSKEIEIMLRQSKGSIVNISSINGLGGTLGAAAYSAAKHGVIALTKSAALEYAKNGIRINVVCPGMINTSMLERVMHSINPNNIKAVKSHFENNIPVNRLGSPQEVAETVFWLSEGRSSFVTGHTLIIDGGMTCQFR